MDYYLYCDESNIHPVASHMYLGGVWIPKSHVTTITAAIDLLKEKHDIRHEFKWENVSTGFLSTYKALVDIFFNHTDIHFRCSILDKDIDTHKRLYNSGVDRAIHSVYVHLISQGIRSEHQYWVYTDKRNVGDKMLTLIQLQKDIHQQSAGNHVMPIRQIEPRDSKKEVLIQLTDILIGAMAYIPNNPDSTGTAKYQLCHYIAHRLGWNSLNRTLPVIDEKVTMMHWKP